MASGRVLRLVVPDYVEANEVKARLMLAIGLHEEAFSRKGVSILNSSEEELEEELKVCRRACKTALETR